MEFSEGISPYSNETVNSGESLYYDFTGYSVIRSADVSLCQQNSSSLSAHISNMYSLNGPVAPELSRTLSNVDPQLQYRHNCIAAALANVMWYWGQHGYPALTSNMTFADVRSDIHNRFNGYFANNSVLTIATAYGTSRCGMVFSGGANWNPTIETVVNEIDRGRPCMVGFAKGSSYSPIEGHMTMGVGYILSPDGSYVRVVDGWSSNIVTRLWTEYNDCVIVLRIG